MTGRYRSIASELRVGRIEHGDGGAGGRQNWRLLPAPTRKAQYTRSVQIAEPRARNGSRGREHDGPIPAPRALDGVIVDWSRPHIAIGNALVPTLGVEHFGIHALTTLARRRHTPLPSSKRGRSID